MIIDYHSPACKQRLSLVFGLLFSLFLLVQDAVGQCTYLLNTDFENTQIASTIQSFNQNTGILSPWRTTARDGGQEVWRGYNNIPAYSGNQFIELNANFAATTYQDFVAPGGTMFTLNFAHRGRDGVDVMNVSIGSPSPTSIANGTAVTGTTYLNLGNFSDGNTAWGYYTVSFTLPTGVANNAFSIRFTSVSAAGGNTSVGNFLDAISISDLAPTLAGSRSVTLACPTTTTSLSGFTATNQPAGTTQTWHTGPVATDANIISSVTAVGPGTYYTAFYNNSKACYGGTTSVVVNGPTGVPAAPTVTLTQPVCALPTGTITITAPLGTGLTYSIDGTNYSSALVYAGVTSGTYAVRARNGTSNLCTSVATSVTINAALLSPAAPTATVTVQPNCTLATGTITVTAPTGTGITYSINGSTYTNTNGIFTGVAPGSYSVTARNTAGCVSPVTSVTVNAQPATPAAPTATVSSQPSCTLATGTITVSAPTGSGLTYSIDGTTYTNTTGVFTGVASGTYAVTVRNSSGCTSSATSVTVNTQPPTPVAPTATVTVQPNCTLATGTITVTAPTGAGLTYSIDGITYTNTSGSFTGVAPGSYSVTVRNSSGCISAATSVTVNAQPPTPETPTATVTAQPNCTLATGTITITAPTGTGLIYSIDGTTYTNTSGVFTGVVPGTYAITVRNASGCISSATSVTVTAQPATPVAPTATVTSQPNCTLATGTITVSAPTGAGLTYSINGSTYTNTSGVFTSVAPGTYLVTVRNSSGCTSAATSVTVTAQPPTPVAPTATVTSQPNCTLATGTITISAPTGAGLTYSIDGTTYTNTNGVFIGVNPGTYAVTVRNSSGCISSPTSVTIAAQPPTPVAPNATVTVQPNCTLATGTITITAPTGAGLTYSIDGITYTNTTGIFTGIAPGTYSVTVRNTAGCISSATSVTVTAQPPTPVAPTATVTSQPNCTLATGTITISAPTGAGLTYSIDGATYTNTSGIFMGVAPGTYAVTVRNASGCISSATSVTVTAQPATPVAPTATVTVQPNCTLATGTITITAPTGTGLTYSINGTTYTNTTGIFTAVAPGSYSVTVRNASGCTSSATSVTVNTQPPTPVAPTATVTVQPNCTLATGTIAVTAPTGAGLTYSIDGTTYTNTTGVFTGVPPGTYAVTVRNSSGCISSATSVTVNSQPATPVLAVNSATVCAGVVTTLTVSGCTGGTLIWSTRDNTTSITVTPLVTTSYSVTCTGSNGCSATGATAVTVRPTPTYSQQPTITLATCTGTVANNNAQITLTGLQNTERADIVANGSYTGGPAYGATSNRLVAGNTVSFTNLPNPASSQPYTVRLFSTSGICVVDVVVTLRPTDCRCTGCPKVLLTPKR